MRKPTWNAAIIALAAALGAAGCASVDGPIPEDARARLNDDYPTFRANPTGARTQIGANAADGQIASLNRTAANASASTPPAVSEAERLRRIRATHEAETIRQIEGR